MRKQLGLTPSGTTETAAAIAQLPAGVQLTVTLVAANVATTTRPTSRTDIPVYWFISDGTSATARPTNAITGDEVSWPQ